MKVARPEAACMRVAQAEAVCRTVARAVAVYTKAAPEGAGLEAVAPEGAGPEEWALVAPVVAAGGQVRAVAPAPASGAAASLRRAVSSREAAGCRSTPVLLSMTIQPVLPEARRSVRNDAQHQRALRSHMGR